MNTVTIPKEQYERMKQQSSLYEKIFKNVSGDNFGVEIYTPERMEEFKKEDQIDPETRSKAEQLLKSLK
jgi:hypothetical protein